MKPSIWLSLTTLVPSILGVFPAFSLAQVIPDQILGSESSIINSIDELRSRIEGGATRGSNLFHSFQEFNVGEGNKVYFANPDGITNIFSRVNGNNISEILGTLGVEGTANLFLINPNGIIFGENASLDIGGSFIATTANRVEFADGTSFAVPTNNPNVTLTISVPIGLGFGSNPGSIIVEGRGNNLSIPIPEFNIIRDDRPTGIEVKSGQTFGLLGGDITLEEGNITAVEGRIELGSVGAGETVGLTSVSEGWKFDYEGVNNFQDISLLQAASIDTSGDSSGAIQVRGQEINVNDGSAILSNTVNGAGGGVTIESNSLQMSGVTSDRFVSVIASDNVDGIGGNIDIETKRLYMSDGSQIRAIVFGNGTTGELNITANDIEVTGINPFNFDYLTSIETSVAIESAGGTGKDVNIDTQSLLVSGGGRILTDVFGSGEGGNLIINAEDIELIEFNNRDISLLTGLSTETRQGNKLRGNAGNIIINTNSLRLIDGARIRADSKNNGNGGDINITAQNIELIGINPINSDFSSRISTSTNNEGNAGSININTDNLLITDGGQIRADTRSNGNAGDININAQNIELTSINNINTSLPSSLITRTRGSGESGNIIIHADTLQVADGAIISADSLRGGNAGNININANIIELTGSNPFFPDLTSGVAASTTDGFGTGGDITINTNDLKVTDGSQIRASAIGGATGKPGDIKINAQNIEVRGVNPAVPDDTELFDTQIASGIIAFTVVSRSPGGEITINAQNLHLAERARIDSTSFNGGDAGLIDLTVDNLFLSADSTITTSSIDLGLGNNPFGDFQIGDAGVINITANNINNNSASITATSELTGGGQINIQAERLTLNNQAEISTDIFESADTGGNITLNSDHLQLLNKSDISASVVGGEGNGGNVTINADTFTGLNGSQITANALQGNGGNITIDTTGYFVSDDFVVSASSDFGLDGTITINTPDNDLQKDLEQPELNIIPLAETFNNSCLDKNRQRGSFVVGGTGGLPLNPNSEYSDSNSTLTGIGSLSRNTSVEPIIIEESNWQHGDPIIPANKMITTPDGRVLLVAAPEKAEDLLCQQN